MRRALGGVILVALGLAVVGCRTDIQSGIDRANDLLYRKQYVASDRLFRKLFRRLDGGGQLDEAEDNQRLLILDRLGKINALYLHDYTAAISYFQTLVRLYPRTDQAFAAHATIADVYHHKLGDLQAAIDAYQKLVAEFPNRHDSRRAQLQIANAYFQLKNFEQARTEAEQLIDRWPKTNEAAQARFQIANSYYVQARYAEAIATYQRLLEDKPEPSVAALVLFELGNCFQGLDQAERALAYFYHCLQDHPDPILVQRKIKRVRKRLHKTRPLPEIYLPEYLKQRLADARRAGSPSPRPRTARVEPTGSVPTYRGAKQPPTAPEPEGGGAPVSKPRNGGSEAMSAPKPRPSEEPKPAPAPDAAPAPSAADPG